MDLRTLRVKHPDTEGAVMIINETDFNPAMHEPADEASAARCEALIASRPVSDVYEVLGDFNREQWRNKLVEMAAELPQGGVDNTVADGTVVNGELVVVDGGLAEGKPSDTSETTSSPDALLADPRQARATELSALTFVELKEKCADLGFVVVPVGTSKVDLVAKVMELEAAAAASGESPTS